MRTAPERVGLVGLGLVGAAIAARLTGAGIPVLGWDAEPSRRAALGEAGGEPARSLADLGSACDTILIAVYDAAQAGSVLDGLPGGGPDRTVVCVTTCGPRESVSLAERCAAAGRTFLECPISGTSQQIRDGASTALLAGDPAASRSVAPLLRTICPTVVPVGAVGDAARMKLAVNLVLQLNRAALAEGIALAESLGLDPGLYLAVVRGSAAYSQVMDTKGDRMVRADYAPQSHIAQTLKDATLILAAGDAAGQPLPLCEVQAALLREAIAIRGGDRDSSAVIEALRSRRRAPSGQGTV